MKVKGFDFFDTLVTRNLYKPTDLFYFVGKFAKEKGIIDISPENFSIYRQKAEVIARKKSIYEEITIDDIYNELLILLSIDKNLILKLKQLEMEIEKKSIICIEENKNKISKSDIILSDTYFSKKFLEDILKTNGIKVADLFVSSELKKTKYTGKLYDEVKKKYFIEYFIGDNEVSDYIKAKEKGIYSFLYLGSKPSRYEKEIYNSNLPFELKTIFSGTMKATRLQAYYEDQHYQTIHNIASNVAGPFLFSYVFWVLRQAKDLGLDTLYYISRDGQILYKIALIVKKYFNYEIELRYLYGSRKAWHFPSINEVDDEVLDWIFDPTYKLSFLDVCKRSELDSEEVANLIKINVPFDKNLSLEERNILKEKFKKEKKIHNLILQKAKQKRGIVIEYLTQEGLNSKKRVGIVDVGWRGRQQVSLSKILYLGNLYPTSGVIGFYVSLFKPVKPFLKDKFFQFLPFDEYSDIISYPGIYESFVAADHGSCIGYKYDKDKIIPILREELNTDMINWGLKVHQDGILLFSENLSKNLCLYKVKFSHEKFMVEKILKIFLKKPSYLESKSYGKIVHYEDQEENYPFNLCQRINTSDLIRIFLRIINNKLNPNIWIESSIILSFGQDRGNLILRIFQIRKKIFNVVKKFLDKFDLILYKVRR